MMRIVNILKQNYLLIAILVLAAALRLYHLDFQSIWLDEIHTMKEASPSLTFKEFNEVIMFREGIPHLYFLLVRVFFEIFGYGIFSARLLSVFFGLGGVFGIYLLGRELSNKTGGLIAAAFLAVNHFHIFFSQEARSYAMLLFFTVFAFYALLRFCRIPNWKNAVFFGVFSGLITHAHPIGLTVIFAQYLVVLFVLVKRPKEERKHFFLMSFLSGIAAIVIFYPVLRIVTKVSDITSFWVPAPTPGVLSGLVNGFLGNSELTWFLFQLLLVMYAITLFRQRLEDRHWKSVSNNQMILSLVVLAPWAAAGFLIPLLKSYLQIPMIVPRYFINILPVFILVFAIGANLIKSATVRITIVISVVVLSLIDLVIVKNYYETPTKTQFREVAETIKKRNTDNARVVSSFGWLMAYFFDSVPDAKPTLETNLEDYVAAMRNHSIPMESFWYMDGNSRPFNLSAGAQKFLSENFIQTKSIDKLDAWGKYYKAKVEPSTGGNLELNSFFPKNMDGMGNLLMFENGISRSPLIQLEVGTYTLSVSGRSLPENPINGENAHLVVKIAGEALGDYYLTAGSSTAAKEFTFENKQSRKGRILLVYDNDFAQNGLDRNVLISSIKLKKIK